MANEKIIDLKERKTVYATADAPHHNEGDEVSCAPAVADKMLAKGWATESKPTGSTAKNKKEKV